MRRTAVILIAILIAGCAGRSSGERPVRDRNLITAEEIAEINVSTAYEVVRQLRPEYLRSRGVTSIRDSSAEQPVVYVSGMRLGGLDQLNAIPATDVESIRYINATDATTRWGTNHTGGVIDVAVRR